MRTLKSYLGFALAGGFALALLGGVLPSYAAGASYETEVVNHVRSGDVSLAISEFELSETGEEIPYHDGPPVLPGQRVSKIVRVKNLAEPAWIRASVSLVRDEGSVEPADPLITPADPLWLKRGDFYYYTEPLPQGGEVDLIREVRIPPFWDSSDAAKPFSLVFSVDAVQQIHFDPDFTATEPWFGTVIESCIHSAYEPSAAREERFSVSFEGGAQGLIQMGDDFFQNFAALMPGDTVSDSVRIRNGYTEPVSVYFRGEGAKEDAFSGEVSFTLSAGEDGGPDGLTFFSGPLSADIAERRVADLEPGEERSLTFTLKVPEGAGNALAASETSVRWIFRAEVRPGDEKDGTPSAASDAGSPGGHGGRGSESSSPKVREIFEEWRPLVEVLPLPASLPQTGDALGEAVLAAGLLLIFSGMAFLSLKRR